MDTSTVSTKLSGLVPAACDAEAGGSAPDSFVDARVLRSSPVLQMRSAISEICRAIRYALDNERETAEDSLQRATEMLREFADERSPGPGVARGGLAPWQIRKVTHYVESHLDQPIRNDELAAIARLNTSHFGRAFRNSIGEPPHEYVIRRRVERAQGLMLSSDAPLSEIALNCGLADQAHLTRVFRRVVGESPRAWRRARSSAPAGCD